MSGLPDKPENYHIVTIELAAKGDHTLVSLSQDNNPTEQACQHLPASLKNLLEN